MIKDCKPILREKVLEQARRPDIRVLVMVLRCLAGPKQSEKAISRASRLGANKVGAIIRAALPPQERLAEELTDVPPHIVSEELLRRVIDSIIAGMEGIAETTIRQELLRLAYWGGVALFVVTHAIHWIAF